MKIPHIWNAEVEAEISLALESVVWTRRGEGETACIEGKGGRWNFKCFELGLDKSRNFEVMATSNGTVFRLPPFLAEKGLRLARAFERR